MTVLLVDDQISILSGLISGLNWDALQVNAIRTASSAGQARYILTQEHIDILLCDIEMPGENGLSLLRWIRSKHMDLICVFLTSHADFLYAKEAIQLECFDYILQPARYDEIQATIAKAIARAKKKNTDKELTQYGTLAKNHSTDLFQTLFLDWNAGKSLSISALCSALKHLGKDLQPDNDCFMILGHLLHWHTEPWPTQEWVYAVNNIITEVYEYHKYGILSFSIDHISLGWFVYAPLKHFSSRDTILEPLQDAYNVIASHFPGDFAFYTTHAVPLESINSHSDVLLKARQNNITRESGVFSSANQSEQVQLTKFLDVTQIRRWEKLLAEGRGDVTYSEVCSYLTVIAEGGKMNLTALRGFWIQFQQLTLNTVSASDAKYEQLITLFETGLGTQSLEETKPIIKNITDCFILDSPSTETENGIIQKVEEYVEDNIDQALSVSNVASALFLSPDYLSRLFKSQTDMSLKEYIIKRKMQSAQILLKTTSLPVSVIASKLGYDNFSHFSQAYRKTMGVSPTDERN